MCVKYIRYIHIYVCGWMYIRMYIHMYILYISYIYCLLCHYSKIPFRTSPMRKNTKGYFYYTNIFQS